MQAILLAAGMGNRIKSVTGDAPKSYLELGGEPLIGRNLRLLRNAGVGEIVLVTGYRRAAFVRDWSAEDVTFAFNPFYQSMNVLSSFWTGMHHLEDDFIFLHADTVFDERVLENLVAEPGDMVLACDRKRCAEEEMKYRTERGRVTEINKTMDPRQSEGEFLGVCRISAGMLPELKATVEAVLERGEFSAFFEVAIQDLIAAGNVPVTVMDVGELPWWEIDFPDDYEAAKAVFG